MTDTTEQQLAAARAEIERLTALLPPLPAPGQVWRVGSKCPSNLYAHADDLAPKGEPVGVMRSAELAAHVVQAVNARANAPHDDAQTVPEATRGTETPAGTEGGRDDLRALRDQIAEALTEWTLSVAAGGRPGHRLLPPDQAILDVNNRARADAVMPVVQAEIDRRDAEIRRLHALFDEAKQSLPIEQRRLLAISRMVFDGIAEGRPFTRDEAADLAQRIVDEIGHSVTDEPALGPSFRVEIEQLKATVDRVRSALADIKTAIDTEMSDDESGLVRSYEILTAALDQGHDELPAVREFAADFDPRGEGS